MLHRVHMPLSQATAAAPLAGRPVAASAQAQAAAAPQPQPQQQPPSRPSSSSAQPPQQQPLGSGLSPAPAPPPPPPPQLGGGSSLSPPPPPPKQEQQPPPPPPQRPPPGGQSPGAAASGAGSGPSASEGHGYPSATDCVPPWLRPPTCSALSQVGAGGAGPLPKPTHAPSRGCSGGHSGAGPVPPRARDLPAAPASGGYWPAAAAVAELPPTVPVLPLRDDSELPPTVPVLPVRGDSVLPAPLPAGPLQPPACVQAAPPAGAGVGTLESIEAAPASGGEAGQPYPHLGTEVLSHAVSTEFSLAGTTAQNFYIGTAEELGTALASGSASEAHAALASGSVPEAHAEDEVLTQPAGSGDLPGEEVFSVANPSPASTLFEVVNLSPLPSDFVDAAGAGE